MPRARSYHLATWAARVLHALGPKRAAKEFFNGLDEKDGSR
jgi:hypothetical protein